KILWKGLLLPAIDSVGGLGFNRRRICCCGRYVSLHMPSATPDRYKSQTGLSFRTRSIFSLKTFITLSMSSPDVLLPRLNRIEALASASVKPIASSTWDGSGSADVQAEPDETATTSLTSTMSCSPSTSLKQRLDTCGNRASTSPLTEVASI